MTRTKVCFLGHSAAVSGAEIALRRLLTALDVDPVVVLAEDGPMADLLRADGVDVRVVPLPLDVRAFRRSSRALGVARSLWSFLVFLLATRRAVRASGASLVHTNSMKAHLYGGLVARSLGLPLVWHVRDRFSADYLGESLGRTMRILARWLPDAVLATSASTAATIGRDDVVVIPDNQTFRGGGADIRPVPRVRDEVTVIGMVGRISPWKGQHVLLAALGQSDLDGARCRIVGSAMFDDAGYELAVRSLAESLEPGHLVEFRGFREDVRAELEDLDVMVHASTIAEPFGQVVIEAMAAGVPVVAADAGGPAEVVTHGVDGLLVPPADPEALASALESLRSPDRRRRLRDAALETASNYTPARTAAAVASVYEGLVGVRPTPLRPASSPLPVPRAVQPAGAARKDDL